MTFREMIDLWPTRMALCADIGVTPQSLNCMRMRDRIPSQYWPAMVQGAKARGIAGITLKTLSAAQRLSAAARQVGGTFTVTITQDGNAIAFDPATGKSASSRTADEAIAELRRLLAAREAA